MEYQIFSNTDAGNYLALCGEAFYTAAQQSMSRWGLKEQKDVAGGRH